MRMCRLCLGPASRSSLSKCFLALRIVMRVAAEATVWKKGKRGKRGRKGRREVQTGLRTSTLCRLYSRYLIIYACGDISLMCALTHTVEKYKKYSISCRHTHTHTQRYSISCTHTHTHTQIQNISHTHTHTHTHTQKNRISHTHTHILSLSHTHTHTHTYSLSHT